MSDPSGDPGAGEQTAGPDPSVGRDDLTRRAFESLYRRRAQDALRYARAILGTQGAEDACQEAWLRIWRSWGSAQEDRREAWAFRIVRNCCVDRLRSAHPAVSLEEADLPPTPSPEESSHPEVMVLLGRLPQPLRECLWLREVMDLSYSEIAGVQEVPIGTVMSRLHAARKKMLKMMRREGL